ncbi:unnamed protein product [Clavelina lepadiformis]|uniref:Mitochondrial import inner membrane translocase subunit TIM50 n=1 Tax=Clavelina lepadiformis TaxID=159417 RepID=A0ABP0G5E9_CLALP
MALRLWTNGLGNKPWKKVTNCVRHFDNSQSQDKSNNLDKRNISKCVAPSTTTLLRSLTSIKQPSIKLTNDFGDGNVEKTGKNDLTEKVNELLMQRKLDIVPLSESPQEHLSSFKIFERRSSSLYSIPLQAQRRNYSTSSSATSDGTNSPEFLEKEGNITEENVKKIMENAKEFSCNTNEAQNEKEDDSSDTKKDGNEEKKESAFLRSQRYASWVLLGTIGIGTPLFILQNGGPKMDEFGDAIPDEFSDSPVVLAYIKRSWGEINMVKREIIEPSSKKLLPDPLQEPYYQPPYTLVVELMDVFLHPVYDSVTGWRFKKRPGIDYFLSQVGPPLFEVVVFTRETGMTAFPLIDSMDQKGYIMYRLFRDAARYKSGFSLGNPFNGEFPKLDPYYQKDLKYLNRDLKRVIMVDCDKRAFERQPLNGLCLTKWDGSSNDTALYDLAALLRTIATSNVDDVRPVLGHYSQSDNPLEAFKQAQARMQEDVQMPVRSNVPSSFFPGTSNAVSSFIKRR